MEFKIEYSESESAWVLTHGDTHYVYQRLKQCLRKVELLLESEPEIKKIRLNGVQPS